MKTILESLVCDSVSTLHFDQLSMFDTLEDMDGVTSVVIPKIDFKILEGFSKFKKDINITGGVTIADESLQSFEGLRVFTADNSVVSKKMENVLHVFIKEYDFAEFMRIKKDSSYVTMYIQTDETNNDSVSDLLMLIQDKDTNTENNVKSSTIISITTTIGIDKIS